MTKHRNKDRVAMDVKLSSDMAAFVETGVADGRYADADEMVSQGLSLLQEQEKRRHAFMAMLAEVEAEVDRGEVFTLEEVMADLDAVIEAAEAHAAE